MDKAVIYKKKNQDNFEEWVAARFGWRLYNIFFKTYTEKVWGVDARSIGSDWASQRIKNLSLMKAILNSFKLNSNKEIVTTLIDEFKYDQDKVAKFIGKSRSHITNCIRLLNLPADVIRLIEEQKLSQGHAKVLVGLENSSQIAKKIIDKKLSVRQAENLVRLYRSSKKFKVISNDSNIKALEKSLQEKTGLTAKIHHKKNNKGILSFEYNNTDQLDRLVMVIKANY